MKTVIFILALTAIAAPVFTAAGDAIACVSAPAGCNVCLEAAAAQCYDCKAGYALQAGFTDTTGTCTRCANGMGIAAGVGMVGSLKAARPTAGTCTACHATCVNCFAPASATGCANCAAGLYASAFTAGTGATCTTCASGKGRAAVAAATADLTAVEATTVCVDCAAGIANCKGTAATDANWCVADYWWAANACTKCETGKTKAAGTAMPTAAEDATKCTAAAATTTTTAKSATLVQALCGAAVAAYALF
jgi:hypothetical protein